MSLSGKAVVRGEQIGAKVFTIACEIFASMFACTATSTFLMPNATICSNTKAHRIKKVPNFASKAAYSSTFSENARRSAASLSRSMKWTQSSSESPFTEVE